MENQQYQELLKSLKRYSESNPEGFPEIVKAFIEQLRNDQPWAFYDALLPHFVVLLQEANVSGVFSGLVRVLHAESDWTPADYKDATEKALRISEGANLWMRNLQKRTY